MTTPRYAELQVTSSFSFLRGASSAEELFAQAALYGIEALGITDRHSLAGIVRAHEAAKVTGVCLVVGCRLDLADGTAVLVYPTDRAAYARLCRLLTLGKGRAGKGRCRLEWSDLAAYAEGLLAILVPDVADAESGRQLRRLHEAFGDRAYHYSAIFTADDNERSGGGRTDSGSRWRSTRRRCAGAPRGGSVAAAVPDRSSL
jgi:error-prone DNA polymerase